MRRFYEKHPALAEFIQVDLSLICAFVVADSGNKWLGIGLLVLGIFIFIFGDAGILSEMFGCSYFSLGVLTLIYDKKDMHFYVVREFLAHKDILTLLMVGCSMVAIISLWRIATEMLAMIWIFFDIAVGVITYLISGNWIIGFLAYVLFLCLSIKIVENGIQQSESHIKGIAVLTLISLPFLSVRYINGRDIKSPKYKASEWKELPIREKKNGIKTEIATFASLLAPGKYVIETHKQMYHLLKKYFPSDYGVVKEKRFPAISLKGRSDFKAIYGEEWKKVWVKRKVYVWYFELEKRGD